MKYRIAFLALCKKELRDLFFSPVAYIAVIVLHLGLALPFIGSGYWFSAGFSDFRPFFLHFPFLFCFVFPLLTMNSWTDEQKHRTDRLLSIYPVPLAVIVTGKYAALCLWFMLMLVISLCIPLSVLPLVYFDAASFLLSYSALVFFGAALLAVSLALSSISAHTPLSFLLSFFVCLFFTVSHAFAAVFSLPPFIAAFLRYCSFPLHFESAARGIFDTRDFFFYIMLIICGIALNLFILAEKESRR